MAESARRTKRRKTSKTEPLEPHMRSSKKNACTVLITCEESTEDGKMQVEMTYEGDSVLAAYLLENAQSILDDNFTSEMLPGCIE